MPFLPLDKLDDEALLDQVTAITKIQLEYIHEMTSPDHLQYRWYADDGLDAMYSAVCLGNQFLDVLLFEEQAREKLAKMTNPKDDMNYIGNLCGDGVAPEIDAWVKEFYPEIA